MRSNIRTVIVWKPLHVRKARQQSPVLRQSFWLKWGKVYPMDNKPVALANDSGNFTCLLCFLLLLWSWQHMRDWVCFGLGHVVGECVKHLSFLTRARQRNTARWPAGTTGQNPQLSIVATSRPSPCHGLHKFLPVLGKTTTTYSPFYSSQNPPHRTTFTSSRNNY